MLPKIICHIMSSVDGRLIPGRWTPPFDATDLMKLFGEYAVIGSELGADAWMFGKTTTAEKFPERFMSHSRKTVGKTEKVHIGHRDSERFFITVDPDADILFTSDTLRGDNIVTVLGPNATVDYLKTLENIGISYIVLSEATDLRRAMELLHEKFGVKIISLQGGGIIDGAMLAAGLLDELSLVVYPGIDGLTTAPSIFEYLGASDERPAQGQSLELLGVETRPHGLLWILYRFHHV